MKHVDPRGLSPGYAHQLGIPLRGLQFGGVISGGVFSAHLTAQRRCTVRQRRATVARHCAVDRDDKAARKPDGYILVLRSALRACEKTSSQFLHTNNGKKRPRQVEMHTINTLLCSAQ